MSTPPFRADLRRGRTAGSGWPEEGDNDPQIIEEAHGAVDDEDDYQYPEQRADTRRNDVDLRDESCRQGHTGEGKQHECEDTRQARAAG